MTDNKSSMSKFQFVIKLHAARLIKNSKLFEVTNFADSDESFAVKRQAYWHSHVTEIPTKPFQDKILKKEKKGSKIAHKII